MWHDAAFSVLFSQKSIAYISLGNDVHPPLYYYFLKVWMLVSTNELWVRALSIVFWALFILYFYKFARKFLPDIVTNISVLMLAWSPTLIYYSIEPRNYTLGMFLVIVQFYYFMTWLKEDYPNTSIDRNAAVFFAILMFWTHYFTILILLPEALLVFMSKRKELRMQAIKMAGVILLGMLPIIIFNLIPSILRMEGFWFKQISPVGYFSSYVYQFILTDSAGALAVCLIWGAILYSVWATFRNEESKYFVVFFIPVTFQWLFSQFHPMYHHRFFLFFSFSLYILIAYGITAGLKEKRKIQYIIKKWAGLLIYLAFLFLLVIYTTITPQFLPHELRDASDFLKEYTRGQPFSTVHTSPFSMTPFRYYFLDDKMTAYLVTNLSVKMLYTAGGAVIPMENVYHNISDVPKSNFSFWISDHQIPNQKTLFNEGGLYVQELK
jgi:hypothetical protein